MRIVSLIASSTELVCALGFKNQLVGRSHECDHPPSVKQLPSCSSPKFKTDGSAYEIDQRVKRVVQESLSVYRVDADKLKSLKPDVIVTQDHCEVCAVSLKDVENAVCDWLDSKPAIVTLRPNSFKDVWEGFRKVADALGAPERGEELVGKCRARIEEISQKAKKIKEHPSVALLEWIHPLMGCGSWMPEMIEMLGGRCAFGEPGKHAPWITWEDLRKKDPDILLIASCGWDIERNLKEMKVLTLKPGWRDLNAVKSGRVYVADGNQYFNRPGPRLVESFEILAEILHPETFPFGYQDRGWVAAPGGRTTQTKRARFSA